MASRCTADETKTIVLGILERASETKPTRIRTSVSADRKAPTMRSEFAAHVEPGSKIYSDEFAQHWKTEDPYEHQMYVSGNVHTDTLENFWSLLKRGLHGTYVAVEPFHLLIYVDEQAFRFNNREMTDVQRFITGMRQIVGWRLTYAQLTGKEQVAHASSQAETKRRCHVRGAGNASRLQ